LSPVPLLLAPLLLAPLLLAPLLPVLPWLVCLALLVAFPLQRLRVWVPPRWQSQVYSWLAVSFGASHHVRIRLRDLVWRSHSRSVAPIQRDMAQVQRAARTALLIRAPMQTRRRTAMP
jgi:hypothetical protein